MTNIEEHKRRISEHLKGIKDAVDEGIEEKPVTIGFHASAGAVEILEFYLHKINMISPGKMIKHNWFERPKRGQKIAPLIERKLPVNFPDKEKIYELMYNIEENRNPLIYGKSSKSQIKEVLESFLQLKEILEQRLEELGEKIE